MESNWIEYKCKSGRSLFIYDKTIERNKRPSDAPVEEKRREFCSIGVQTDNTGCVNGCTSKYVKVTHTVARPVHNKKTVSRPTTNKQQNPKKPANNKKNTSIQQNSDDVTAPVSQDLGRRLEDRAESSAVNMNEIDKAVLEILGGGNDANLIGNNSQAGSDQEEVIASSNCVREEVIVAGSTEKSFECVFCQKKLKCKSALESHVRSHTGARPFQCSYCPKNFALNSNLKRHTQIHTEEKKFECHECKKKFLRIPSLKVHLRTHTGEKPFVCSYCQKRFTQKKHLNVHLKLHTGENLFTCPYCGKKFKRKDNLRTHLKIHSGG
ncbi:zinc finger protein 282 [Exaiptasia diaphana]|uniref:C2H2-type domain-containing protein n=1 Tax=Exaiptasia diaphana TaxID=2652724 RepID=A0A913YMC1_EXADI|nr:zinc finger protein 282 [Exaiptasia diaphana]KXJ11613.1 Gastrula zinc finger protein XlCGF57.1 [Exaiptasia diaphana]